MTATKCIITKARKGAVSPTKVKKLEALVDKLRRESTGPNAELIANEQALQIMTHRLAKKRQRVALMIRRNDEVSARIARAPSGGRGAMSMLSRDLRDGVVGDNVEYRYKTLMSDYHSLWADGLERFRAKTLGLRRDKAGLDNTVREIKGENTGDQSAAEIAQAWKRVGEHMRNRFNAAGGDIPMRQNWDLPNPHYDLRIVSRTNKGDFVDDMMDAVDPNGTIDYDTGLPVTPDKLRELLEDAYETIRMGGLNKATPGTYTRGQRANRYSDARVFNFKNADAWIAINNKYSRQDIFSTLVHHIDAMARETALIEILGPNPDAMVKVIQDKVRIRNAEEGLHASAGLGEFDRTYEVLTGRIYDPETPWWADANAFTRNILTAAQLGGAFLSAITDLNFQRMTAQFNGLSATKVIARQMKLMHPSKDQKLAVQIGLIAESWSSTAFAQQRFIGDVMGPALSRRISDFVMRASLLSPWTQAGRWAFGMEYLGYLARNRGKTFAELDKPMRNSFERYGVTPDDWDIIRSSPVHVERGAEFVSYRNITNTDSANRLMQAVLTETDFAIPAVTARVQAQMTFGAKAGSFWSEAIKNVSMYKSFPTTVIHTHLMRGIGRPGFKKGQYLASLIIGTTIMGALAYQAKQMQRGKDPQSMDPTTMDGAKFWVAALVQGGGLGLFGDFLFQDTTRFGGGFTETAIGPFYGFVEDVDELTRENLWQLAQGEDPKFGRDLVKFLARYTPGSSIWYTRLALERLVIDEALRQVDPEAYKSFRTIERNARDATGQEYWWGPGQTEPSRAPELP